MKKTFTLCLFVGLLASCGSKQTVSNDEPTEEVVATTEDIPDNSAEEPADSSMLPPPPDVAAAPPNAETSPSGLAWTVLDGGEDGGPSPTLESVVKVHYTGWTTDGKMFDSSAAGDPIEFPLNKLIAGWQEGIPMMTRGEKRRFWIPSDLAYGKSTREGVPQGLLVFDIELIDFK